MYGQSRPPVTRSSVSFFHWGVILPQRFAGVRRARATYNHGCRRSRGVRRMGGNLRREVLTDSSESDITDSEHYGRLETLPASLAGRAAYPAGPLKRRPPRIRDHAGSVAAIRR